MGRQSIGQGRFFYSFDLESHIPQNHLLRSIDRCLDLSDLHKQLADHYSRTGRPSIDPELMIRMLIIGYSYGIRSERRLCEEVHLNLGYRWFCRLSLEDAVPDHSTFSKNRHGRFRASGIFRWLFDEVVQRCMQAGLIKGEGFAVDASIIAADANKQRSIPGVTGQRRCWRGWWMRKASNRMCQCGTKPSVKTTHSQAAIFIGMNKPMNIVALKAMRCAANGDLLRNRERTLQKQTPLSIAPARSTAPTAH